MSEENINFQIQYFPKEKREEFKAWCAEHNMSMKEMLIHLIDNSSKINKSVSFEK